MVDDISGTEIYSRLKITMHKVIESVELDKITPASRWQEDLKIDSIRVVELMIAIEDEFGILIEDETIAGIQTVGDALNIIKKKMG